MLSQTCTRRIADVKLIPYTARSVVLYRHTLSKEVKLHLSCVRATSHCAANGRRHFYYIKRGMFRCHHHPDWRPLVSAGCRGRQFSIITSIGRSWGLSVRVSEWLLSVVCSRVWFLGLTFWLQALYSYTLIAALFSKCLSLFILLRLVQYIL